MKLKKAALIIVLGLVSPSIFAEDAPATSDLVYQIKAGSNLSTLTNGLLDRPTRWNDVARYNHLNNAHLVQPNQILYVPLAWLKNYPAQARIESVTGDVKLNGKAAQVGDLVATGDKLETAVGASTRLTLPDQSSLSLLEKTQLHATNLEQKKQGNFFNAVFRLVTGRIDAIKRKYPEGQAPLRIQAMSATIGVRGTHFRMGQEGGNTLAEIENGLVSFGDETKGKKQPIALAAGEGSLSDGVRPPAVIPLLPAPVFPAMPAELPSDNVSFDMPALVGVTGYRGEIASDADFQNIIASVAAEGNHVQLNNLAVGRYAVRLRAVDSNGLQGLQAARSIVVALPPPPPAKLPTITPFVPIVSGGQMLTGWAHVHNHQYQVEIASSADFTTVLQKATRKEDYWTFATPSSGNYWMRLRVLNAQGRVGDWSEAVTFSVP